MGTPVLFNEGIRLIWPGRPGRCVLHRVFSRHEPAHGVMSRILWEDLKCILLTSSSPSQNTLAERTAGFLIQCVMRRREDAKGMQLGSSLCFT
ncbi:hypothetical protein J4Q44_G00357930 [Coregonus suidteri]|uniref:Uncharacterized protein n=1 Tax=Coregonus suidteri TaxID=861788 RepID=A0AAN8QL08_9TELE